MRSWRDQAYTGIAGIDEAHAQLTRLIGVLQAAFAAGRGREEITPVLDELEAYARKDFEHEEQAMRESAYPALDEHLAEHERFAEQLRRLRHELETVGATSVLAVRTQRHIREWLLGHLAISDKDLSEHLRRCSQVGAQNECRSVTA